MVGTRHILGLAIDDSGVVATELSLRSGRPAIRSAGEFRWGRGLAPDTAGDLGQALRQFLRDHGFSAKRAVVGLAAKWVLAREITAPPASPDALADMLTIQAERAFSINADELIFDYCGGTSTVEKSQVLLLAVRRQTVDLVKGLAAAAGLQVQAVTVSALACSKALCESGPAYRYGLYSRPTYCEFWGQSNGSPRFVKHIPVGMDGNAAGYADLLTSMIQRQVFLSSRQSQPPPYEVTAYDAGGLSDGILGRLSEQLGPQITVHDGSVAPLCGVLGLADRPEGAYSAAAAAVAWTALETDGPPVDFLSPRIGAKKVSGRKRVVAWVTFAVAACLLGLAAVLADWHGDRSDIAAYTEQLQQMSEDIAVAQEVVTRVSHAASWASREPHFLDCLRELTLAFPEEGSVWATSLALTENGTGSLVGKARSEASFYGVLDKIRDSQAFSDVQMIHIRDAGRDSQEEEFAINFTFRGLK